MGRAEVSQELVSPSERTISGAKEWVWLRQVPWLPGLLCAVIRASPLFYYYLYLSAGKSTIFLIWQLCACTKNTYAQKQPNQ